MSKTVSLNNKLCILREIRDVKHILFSSFSDKLTKIDKTERWKAIHVKAMSLGLVPPGQEWTYTRDVFWQNLKKATMKKVDNRRKTGSGGGIDCKYTEVDHLVLDIIGRDNPVVTSLGVSETFDILRETELITGEQINASAKEITTSNSLGEDSSNMMKDIDSNEDSNANRGSYIQRCSNTREMHSSAKQKGRKKTAEDNSSEEASLLELKKKKIQNEIIILEKESYLKS